MINILSLLILFTSWNLFAVTTVRWSNESTPQAFITKTNFATSSQINIDEIVSSASTLSNTSVVYSPFNNSTITNLNNLTTLTNTGDIPTAAAGKIRLMLDFEFNSGGNNKSIYIAYEDTADSNKLKVIKELNFISNITSSPMINQPVDLLFSDLCADIKIFDCSLLNDFSSTIIERQLYFFIADTNSIAPTSVFTPIGVEGLFIKLSLSSNPFIAPGGASNIVSIVLNDLKKGDRRLWASWTGTNTVFVNRVMACIKKAPGSVSPGASPRTQCASVNDLIDLSTISFDGSGFVKPLENGQSYCMEVFFENKWKLTTNLSSDSSALASNCATPEEIEVLLKRQACFLLTAGFGGNHPTVEFFRFLRDRVLLHSALGQLFVHTYYFLAPKAAMTIFKSKFLSAFIRNSANIFSWFIHYIFYFFISIGSLLIIFYLYYYHCNKKRNIS